MSKSIKGTQTEKNLLTSFAGESQARMRYTYFASVAKKEGYEQISAIFTETADQEKEHAKRMFKFLEGGMVEITASYPAGVIGTTLENLQAAAAGEHEEWSLDYPHFADVAEQEGFPEIFPLLKKDMKNATVLLSKTSKPLLFSPRKAKWYGSAVTAVLSTQARKLLRYVRLVCIRRLTSR